MSSSQVNFLQVVNLSIIFFKNVVVAFSRKVWGSSALSFHLLEEEFKILIRLHHRFGSSDKHPNVHVYPNYHQDFRMFFFSHSVFLLPNICPSTTTITSSYGPSYLPLLQTSLKLIPYIPVLPESYPQPLPLKMSTF